MESFIDDVKLRGFTSEVSYLSAEEVQSCFSRPRIKATAHSFGSVLKSSILFVEAESARLWAMQLLEATWLWRDNMQVYEQVQAMVKREQE